MKLLQIFKLRCSAVVTPSMVAGCVCVLMSGGIDFAGVCRVPVRGTLQPAVWRMTGHRRGSGVRCVLAPDVYFAHSDVSLLTELLDWSVQLR